MHRATTPVLLLIAASAGLAGLAACTDTAPLPGPIVDFLIDAPLCSSRIPVEFSIDGTIVGIDTFVVHIAPTEHLRSRLFAISPGQHTLHARTSLYAWPDKTVTLAKRQYATDTLPFYCS